MAGALPVELFPQTPKVSFFFFAIYMCMVVYAHMRVRMCVGARVCADARVNVEVTF